MTAVTPLVEWEGVSKTYPGRSTPALDAATLTIQEGEYIAITGPSGSGKTTVLNLLGLVDRPTQGTARFDGVDLSRTTARGLTHFRRQISFVFQEFFLLEDRTVLDNVMLPLTYRGIAPADQLRPAREALERVGLSGLAESRASQLSGGQRQRVTLARAVVSQPRLLLCDEPTGSLDSVNADAVLDIIAATHAQGCAVVMVTHDPRAASRAPRAWSLKDGHITTGAAATAHAPREVA